MSHTKTIEDLNSSVGELASLMKDTFTCCMKNYEALLPYIGKKETNFKIHHKLVQVNILLNKLSEELVGLRVEFLTVSSYEQRGETILSESNVKKRKSDVLELGRQETKTIQIEVPFSSNRKCCIALTPETGINMQTENLMLMNTEETSHTQVQKTDMHRTKYIKTEVQDSKEVEVLLVSPIGNSDRPTAQTPCDTIHNGVTVSETSDDDCISVADSISVRGDECDGPADKCTQRENTEECYLLQRSENETSNQEKCEDTGSVFTKDHGSHRGLRGEADCTTSFYDQYKRPFRAEEPHFASTAYSRESDRLLQGRLNEVNNKKNQSQDTPVVCQIKESSQDLCNTDDELYGVIRHHNERFNCTLCNCVLVGYYAINLHVKGIKHRNKLITVKKNSCDRVSEVPNNSCESELVNLQVVHGLVKERKRKRSKRKQNTVKKRFTNVSEIISNSCENKHVNYQPVQGHRKQKNYKKKQIIAMNSCSKESEVISNSCENELINYQVQQDQVKLNNYYKRKQITAKKRRAKESEVASNTTQCKVV